MHTGSTGPPCIMIVGKRNRVDCAAGSQSPPRQCPTTEALYRVRARMQQRLDKPSRSTSESPCPANDSWTIVPVGSAATNRPSRMDRHNDSRAGVRQPSRCPANTARRSTRVDGSRGSSTFLVNLAGIRRRCVGSDAPLPHTDCILKRVASWRIEARKSATLWATAYHIHAGAC